MSENTKTKAPETQAPETQAPETTVNTNDTKAPETPTGAQAPGVEERVELMVPRGRSNEDPNLLISVNGVNYLLPRGKIVSVPKHVAYEYNRAQRAEAALYEKQEEMIRQGQMPKQQGAVV